MPNVAEVPLWRGNRVVAHAVVDIADLSLVDPYHWYLDGKGYARASLYQSETQETRAILLHRLILNFPAEGIDHIDMNPLNNTRSNLRLANQSQNAQNQPRINGFGSSRYRGVYWHKAAGKWMAYAQLNRKRYYLGLFELEQDAANVVSEWRSRHMTHSVEDSR